jgi:hypothetical protein
VTSCRICVLYFIVFLFHIFDWILLVMSMWGFGRRRSWSVWKGEHDSCLKRPRRSDKIIAEFDRYNLVLQACKSDVLLVPKLEEDNLSRLYWRVATDRSRQNIDRIGKGMPVWNKRKFYLAYKYVPWLCYFSTELLVLKPLDCQSLDKPRPKSGIGVRQLR